MSLPRKVLEKYIRPGCLFVETGARWGDACIKAVEAGARHAHTCETDQLMATIAQMHCDDLVGHNVTVQCMDSETFLGFTGLEKTHYNHRDTVVFLDAHTETSSPIIKELGFIDRWASKPGVILIDDLRCMKGWGISIDDLMAILIRMGYQVSHEEGVEYMDILVGVR